MVRKKLFPLICFILVPFTIWSSERTSRPVQLQLVNFSGVALGYHISDSIFLGYTYVSSMDLSLEPQNPSALYGQDYVEKMDVEENQELKETNHTIKISKNLKHVNNACLCIKIGFLHRRHVLYQQTMFLYIMYKTLNQFT